MPSHHEIQHFPQEIYVKQIYQKAKRRLNLQEQPKSTNTKQLIQIIKVLHEEDEKTDVMKRVGNTVQRNLQKMGLLTRKQFASGDLMLSDKDQAENASQANLNTSSEFINYKIRPYHQVSQGNFHPVSRFDSCNNISQTNQDAHNPANVLAREKRLTPTLTRYADFDKGAQASIHVSPQQGITTSDVCLQKS